jgi:hypothetical protein
VRRLLALNLERSKPTAEWVAAPAGAVIGMTCSQLLVAGGEASSNGTQGWYAAGTHGKALRTEPVRN